MKIWSSTSNFNRKSEVALQIITRFYYIIESWLPYLLPEIIWHFRWKRTLLSSIDILPLDALLRYHQQLLWQVHLVYRIKFFIHRLLETITLPPLFLRIIITPKHGLSSIRMVQEYYCDILKFWCKNTNEIEHPQICFTKM